MRSKLAVLVASVGFVCLAMPAVAHHAFETDYDIKKPFELTGVVTQVSWTNPHMRLYVDITDANGKVTNWNLEMSSPNHVLRNGWGPNDVKPGDKVIVKGFSGKVVESRAVLTGITTADGRQLFAPGGPGVPDTSGR